MIFSSSSAFGVFPEGGREGVLYMGLKELIYRGVRAGVLLVGKGKRVEIPHKGISSLNINKNDMVFLKIAMNYSDSMLMRENYRSWATWTCTCFDLQ